MGGPFCGSSRDPEKREVSFFQDRFKAGVHLSAQMFPVPKPILVKGDILLVREDVEGPPGEESGEGLQLPGLFPPVPLVPDRGGERICIADENGARFARRLFFPAELLGGDVDEVLFTPDEFVHLRKEQLVASGHSPCDRKLRHRELPAKFGDPAGLGQITSSLSKRCGEVLRERRRTRGLRTQDDDSEAESGARGERELAPVTSRSFPHLGGGNGSPAPRFIEIDVNGDAQTARELIAIGFRGEKDFGPSDLPGEALAAERVFEGLAKDADMFLLNIRFAVIDRMGIDAPSKIDLRIDVEGEAFPENRAPSFEAEPFGFVIEDPYREVLAKRGGGTDEKKMPLVRRSEFPDDQPVGEPGDSACMR